MNKEKRKEVILIISSFLIGGIVMVIILRYTPLRNEVLGSKNGYIITKDKTKVIEKGSLAPAIEKVKDAVVSIQG